MLDIKLIDWQKTKFSKEKIVESYFKNGEKLGLSELIELNAMVDMISNTILRTIL